MLPIIDWMRWVGLAIVMLLPLIGAFMVFYKPLGKGESLSMHIASNKYFYYVMGIFLTVAGAFFYGFLAFWVIPFYNLPATLYLVLGLSYIAQLGLSWIPDSKTNTRLHDLHFFCGSFVAVSIIFFLTILLIYGQPALNFFGALFALASIVSFCLYFFFKNSKKYFLIYESSFLVLFCLTIVALIFQI